MGEGGTGVRGYMGTGRNTGEGSETEGYTATMARAAGFARSLSGTESAL